MPEPVFTAAEARALLDTLDYARGSQVPSPDWSVLHRARFKLLCLADDKPRVA